MSRDRHQKGWVEETGKQTKKWKGHYFVYVNNPNGTERRAHRAVILGRKSEMKKWEAQAKLQAIIDEATAPKKTSSNTAAATLDWFWRERYRPIKEPTWKVSSRARTVQLIEHLVITPFGSQLLADIGRFDLQQHINALAEGGKSYSTVSKFRVYVHALLDEALEQGFVERNVARKLSLPHIAKPEKRVLTEDELAAIMGELSGRDRLILRMFFLLGLRPGELFALRRNDKLPGRLRIDESVSVNRHITEPKRDASAAMVWLPASLEAELDFWLESQEDQRSDAFMFPTKNATPLNTCNYLFQVLKPAAARANVWTREVKQGDTIKRVSSVNHQAMRRTCATYLQSHGTVKDVQAHLRHASATTTLGVYVQEIPASVRAAVEALDAALSPKKNKAVN